MSQMIRPKFAFEDQQNQVIKIEPQSQSHLIEHQNLFEISAEQSRVELASKQQDQQIRKKSNTNHTTKISNNSKSSQTTEKHHLEIHPQDINDLYPSSQVNPQGTFAQTNSYLTVPEMQRPRKKSTSYQEKVDLFHKGTASQIKPNMFVSPANGNGSPVLQNYSNYSFKPQEAEKAYDPYDQRIRTKKMKIQSRIASSKKAIVVDELPLEEKGGQKKNLDQIISQNSSNIAFGHYQSTIIVNQPANPKDFQIHPFSQEKIQQSLKSIFNNVSSVTEFQLLRQKKCCFNYMNPDFRILRKDGSVAIAAKKQFCHFNSYYNITVSQIVAGCLRGNFGGSEFNLYRFKQNQQELVATIIYETSFACATDFRKIQVYIKNQNNNDLMFAGETKRKNLKQLFDQGYSKEITKIATKEPKWCHQSQCFTLNFKGKGKLPSIKNMILVPQQTGKATSLTFCKREPDSFYLQIDPSLSIFTTMGILMSSFDFKLFCQ